MADKYLSRWLRRLAGMRRRRRRLATAIQKLRGTIARRRRKLAGTPGERALRAAGRMLGKTESPPNSNDGPWLREMERDILAAGGDLDWMIPGQPYCGFGCIWAWLKGVGLKLPDGTVYTPNIPGYTGLTIAAKDGRKYKLVSVAPENAKPGALVVMDFTGDRRADHVALARGPMKGGVIPTRDFNTSPGNSGSQANGGGVFDRLRYRSNVIHVLNIVSA